MIVLAAFIIGGVLGGLRAARLGGGGKDIAQYVIVFALIFAMLGLFATILIERMA